MIFASLRRVARLATKILGMPHADSNYLGKAAEKMGRSEQGERPEIRSSPNRPPVWPRGKQRPACSVSLQINSSLFSTRSTPISTATSGSGVMAFTSLMEGRPPISPPCPIYRKTIAWVLPRTTTESIFPAWGTQIETGVRVKTIVLLEVGPDMPPKPH